MRIYVLITATVAAFNYCSASEIDFFDNQGQLSVTIDGAPIANGGRVSNLLLGTESISFDLTVNGTTNVLTETGFTRLFEPGDASTVSDIFIDLFRTGSPTYHVVFGSAPNLPTIPGGAIDLTTIPQQGLPASPYFEDGSMQKVGTAFASDGSKDTFFVQSTAVPEPGSLLLLSASGLAFALRSRNSSKVQ